MFFSGIDINSMSGDIPETVFAAFQMTFAIITPALIVGAFRRTHKVFIDAYLQHTLDSFGLLSCR